MARQTVLVIGSSGNIGVSVIIGALNAGLDVIAVVRSTSSKEKVLDHLKSVNADEKHVMFTEADVTKEEGIVKVMEQVKSGKLPDFQHVYAAIGTWEPKIPMYTLDTTTFRQTMNTSLESTFFTYRTTAPYLIEKGHPDSTWTLITGGAGEMGAGGVTAISQGALFSFATAACLENRKTNIRFNEVYLNYRVDYDSVCDKDPDLPDGSAKRMRSSEFARVYEKILADKNVNASRVTVAGFEDIEKFNIKKKLTVTVAGYKF